jgi:hypothetical protein
LRLKGAWFVDSTLEHEQVVQVDSDLLVSEFAFKLFKQMIQLVPLRRVKAATAPDARLLEFTEYNHVKKDAQIAESTVGLSKLNPVVDP